MKISDRLKTVASLIKEHSNVIDVGADHGLLEKYLIDNKKVDYVLAIENKEGPFNILKNNLKDYDVELSLNDGLSYLPSKVDTIVIAGMGGILISDILTSQREKLGNIKQIVVDAHRDIELVRRTVTSMGFYIEKEVIVYENDEYYFVISFLRGTKQYSNVEYEWGYKVAQDPLFKQYKEYQVKLLGLNLIRYCSSEKANKAGIKARKDKIRRLSNL